MNWKGVGRAWLTKGQPEYIHYASIGDRGCGRAVNDKGATSVHQQLEEVSAQSSDIVKI